MKKITVLALAFLALAVIAGVGGFYLAETSIQSFETATIVAGPEGIVSEQVSFCVPSDPGCD